jgi:hypothetical protein
MSKSKAFVDVLKAYLMSNKFIQLQFLIEIKKKKEKKIICVHLPITPWFYRQVALTHLVQLAFKENGNIRFSFEPSKQDRSHAAFPALKKIRSAKAHYSYLIDDHLPNEMKRNCPVI